MKASPNVDTVDFTILDIVAKQPTISSWDVCQQLFSEEKDSKKLQNHLSSVIWRMRKLVQGGYLKRLPHPTRPKKAVYSLPALAFSVDGTIFIPSKAGGIIINCTHKEGCMASRKCTFGGPNCKLANDIKQQGLESALRIAEILSRINTKNLNG